MVVVSFLFVAAAGSLHILDGTAGIDCSANGGEAVKCGSVVPKSGTKMYVNVTQGACRLNSTCEASTMTVSVVAGPCRASTTYLTEAVGGKSKGFFTYSPDVGCITDVTISSGSDNASASFRCYSAANYTIDTLGYVDCPGIETATFGQEIVCSAIGLHGKQVASGVDEPVVIGLKGVWKTPFLFAFNVTLPSTPVVTYSVGDSQTKTLELYSVPVHFPPTPPRSEPRELSASSLSELSCDDAISQCIIVPRDQQGRNRLYSEDEFFVSYTVKGCMEDMSAVSRFTNATFQLPSCSRSTLTYVDLYLSAASKEPIRRTQFYSKRSKPAAMAPDKHSVLSCGNLKDDKRTHTCSITARGPYGEVVFRAEDFSVSLVADKRNRCKFVTSTHLTPQRNESVGTFNVVRSGECLYYTIATLTTVRISSPPYDTISVMKNGLVQDMPAYLVSNAVPHPTPAPGNYTPWTNPIPVKKDKASKPVLVLLVVAILLIGTVALIAGIYLYRRHLYNTADSWSVLGGGTMTKLDQTFSLIEEGPSNDLTIITSECEYSTLCGAT